MTAAGIEDLVADRILRVYRKEHDANSLRVFMSDVIAKADGDYLYRDRVVKWLGAGTEIVVPQGMPGAGRPGHVYHAKNEASESYCFVYKDRWLPAPVAKNCPVLDKLIRVQETGGNPSWTVIRECPESPGDTRAKPHQ